MKKNNIYRSAAQVTVFSTIEKGLSFFYRIILTRFIGAEGIGIYQLCLTVFAVFLTMSSSGVPVTVSRLMAKSNAQGDIKSKHAAVTAGIVLTLAVTVPVALIMLFAKNAFSFLFADKRCLNLFIILLPGLILTSVYAVIRGSFWGNKQFLPYSVIELLEDALMVFLGIALVYGVSDPVSGAQNAIIAVLISYIFSFCASLFWYFKKGGRLVSPKEQLKPLISSSVPITAMRTSTSLLNSVVAVLLPALLMGFCGMSSSEAISLYGICVGMAVPIIFIPNSLIGSIAVVVAPELSENYYSGKTKAVTYDVEKSVKAAIFISVLLLPLLFALGRPLGEFLYGNELSGDIVRYASFIMLPMCITMMTNTVLNSMNCEKRTLIYFLIGGAAMLISVLGLTKFIGVYSYIVGLALNFTVCAALNLKLLKQKCPTVKFGRYTLISAAVIAVSCLFGSLFSNLFTDFKPFVQIVICTPVQLLFTALALYALEMMTLKPFKKLLARGKT